MAAPALRDRRQAGAAGDPYDLSQVFVCTPDGWVTAPWTHLPMISAPFADLHGVMGQRPFRLPLAETAD